MTTINCYVFLGGMPERYGLETSPKVVSDDGHVYVWRNGKWTFMSEESHAEIEEWIACSDPDRLIIRGKLRIKV